MFLISGWWFLWTHLAFVSSHTFFVQIFRLNMRFNFSEFLVNWKCMFLFEFVCIIYRSRNVWDAEKKLGQQRNMRNWSRDARQSEGWCAKTFQVLCLSNAFEFVIENFKTKYVRLFAAIFKYKFVDTVNLMTVMDTQCCKWSSLQAKPILMGQLEFFSQITSIKFLRSFFSYICWSERIYQKYC